jgi:hypothetical protein
MRFGHQHINAEQHIVSGDIHQALLNLEQIELLCLRKQSQTAPDANALTRIQALFHRLRAASFSH